VFESGDDFICAYRTKKKVGQVKNKMGNIVLENMQGCSRFINSYFRTNFAK